MKIAIQGHPTRGKEVIQILESLGGKNNFSLEGNNQHDHYGIYENNIIILFNLKQYKLYTLEEFEKEFPFKIGDKVIDYEGDIAVITEFIYIEEKLGYFLQYEHGRGTATPRMLKPYKEMKEERNITLTFDKAKEWYKKGGELKEIALQAFSEKELNPLPRSWEEFCIKYGIVCFSTRYTNIPLKYDALIKLEQLRDCWRHGWKPKEHAPVYVIKFSFRELSVYQFNSREFLSFPTKEMAEEFLKCFRDLIEKAGDLI